MYILYRVTPRPWTRVICCLMRTKKPVAILYVRDCASNTLLTSSLGARSRQSYTNMYCTYVFIIRKFNLFIIPASLTLQGLEIILNQPIGFGQIQYRMFFISRFHGTVSPRQVSIPHHGVLLQYRRTIFEQCKNLLTNCDLPTPYSAEIRSTTGQLYTTVGSEGFSHYTGELSFRQRKSKSRMAIFLH